MTADHLIEVDGDHAHMNAQFIVLRIQATARPAGGWPGATFGAQGSVQPIESGYYDTELRRIDGEWKIVGHRILLGTLMPAIGDGRRPSNVRRDRRGQRPKPSRHGRAAGLTPQPASAPMPTASTPAIARTACGCP